MLTLITLWDGKGKFKDMMQMIMVCFIMDICIISKLSKAIYAAIH